jgi:fumarylacetoacetase
MTVSKSIQLTSTANSEEYHMADCNTNNVIFSFAQMIAHHTRGGCPLQTGDLLATGTLSGPSREEAGCLLERTRGGKEPFEMKGGESTKGSVRRIFCEDNDIITFTAHAKSSDGLGNVGFGACQGQVLPAI